MRVARSFASRATTEEHFVDVARRASAALERLGASTPMHLDALMKIFSLNEDIQPTTATMRRRAHPLVIPLAETRDGRHVYGLYVGRAAMGGARTSATNFSFFHKSREDVAASNSASSAVPGGINAIPIVRSGPRGLMHLAADATHFVRRKLAEDERDFGVGAGAVTLACGADALDAYAPGELTSSPFKSRMEVFLTKNVGRFMDVDEALIARHVEKKDETSALVTGEWYTDGPYAGWARPYAVNADTLMRHGRAIEARDQARVALSAGPWWTIGDDGELLSRMKVLSGYDGRSAADVRKTLEGGDVAVGQNVNDGEPPPTPEELALKAAGAAMDAIAWGEGGGEDGWASCREVVAERLEEAGLAELSAHVVEPLRSSSQS